MPLGFAAPAVLAALADRAITTLHLVPTMIEALLREREAYPVDLPRLRTLLYAASPIPLDLLRECMDAVSLLLAVASDMTEMDGFFLNWPLPAVLMPSFGRVLRDSERTAL